MCRNGIKQRRMSWQDGVLGTNCPIQPNSNWTYHFQLKDQIGTYTYFASTSMHRASGAFGALNVYQRSVIFVPYPKPDSDFTLLVSDWYKMGQKVKKTFKTRVNLFLKQIFLGFNISASPCCSWQEMRKRLDSGRNLPLPDGLLINGVSKGLIFTGQHGKSSSPRTNFFPKLYSQFFDLFIVIMFFFSLKARYTDFGYRTSVYPHRLTLGYKDIWWLSSK